MALLNNAWVDSYLEALLSAGLSTEAARKASEQHGSPDVDADSNLAAKFYVQQILAMDEESIQQAWLKVRARSNVRLAAERDSRLEHICWRVWSMRRKGAAVRLLRETGQDDPDHDLASDARSEEGGSSAGASHGPGVVDDEELSKLMGTSPASALRRLSIPPRRGGAGGGLGGGPARVGSMDLLSESSDETGAPPLSPSDPPTTPAVLAAAAAAAEATPKSCVSPAAGAAAAAADALLNLGEGRVPKLYCVLISMHGLVRGDRMELGKDPDTGGQVKYVVELARALSRHPAVHRVDLLTRLIRDPAVDGSYGQEEEALGEGQGGAGGAFIVRLPCGPVDKYIRKEALWPHVREFADNALAHVTGMMTRLAAAGETCQLYDIHGHYADAGEAAALMSFTLGVDMVLTGHSLGRNKLEHLLKSRTMSRREIESTYAMSRRIEGEERALDAAMMVFTSTHQEVKDQWGLYDGYNPALASVIRQRPRRGRHFPVMKVVPPGLDFSNLKVDCPPDPWQQLAAASAASGMRSRRTSVASVPSAVAALAAAQGSAGALVVKAVEEAAAHDKPAGAATSPKTAAPHSSAHARGGGSKCGPSPFLQAALPQELSLAQHASPRAPATPPLPGAGGSGAWPALGGGGPSGPILTYEDPPIWQEIFRFLRNPRKPVILAMSRPDAKKNITTLVRAFGENRTLREIANLVLVMGNRTVIDRMAAGSAKVLNSVLNMIDKYDLYGSVAYPKGHTQDDISDIYLLPHYTRGVFVNIALQEPFGLTLIEAAAHGVPIVATTNGGPVDIIHTLHNGVLVDPTDPRAVSEALLKLLTDPGLWEQYATAGRENINAYSWPSHCITCLNAVEREKLKAHSRRRTAARSTYSADMDDIADRIASMGGAAAAAAGGRADDDGAAADGAASAVAAAPFASLDDLALKGVSTPILSSSPSRGHFLGTAPGAAAAPGAWSPRARLSLDGGALPGATGGGVGAAAVAAASTATGGLHGAVPFKSRYVVLVLDGPDSTAGLSSLLLSLRRAAAAAGVAAGGQGARSLLAGLAGGAAGGAGGVRLGVASACPLQETLALLGGAGVGARDVDFAVTNFGSQIWYCGAAAAAAATAAAGGAAAAAAGPDSCASDSSYEAFIDFRWDKISVRRILAHLLAQPGLLSGLSGAGGRGGPTPPLRVRVDTETCSHHLLLTVQRRDGALSPALTAQEAAALAARVRRRFRASGVRAQVAALVGADGAARLHITPLRASRAMAVRYLALQHGVPLSDLVFVSCARGGADVFGASDAEELIGGVQRVLVVPAAGYQDGDIRGDGDGGDDASLANGHEQWELPVGQLPGGFKVDLGSYQYSERVQVLPAATLYQ